VNWNTPTIGYKDSNGYEYVETSESWQKMCSELPCFDALQWPGYDSIHLDIEINSEPVGIQLWKGWCQKFLGLQFFPGGIGAEVGVYRRIPGKLRPDSLPFLPDWMEAFILEHLTDLTDNDLWWPAPDLRAQLQFTFINPKTDRPMFTAGPETSYWLCKWMNESSYYFSYVHVVGVDRVPVDSTDYILEYTINGQTRRW
jgi:hypothetical protein